MSRSPAILLAISLPALPSAALAQEDPAAASQARVEAMIDKANAQYMPRRTPRCGTAAASAPGEIVVCAPDNERERVPSSSESDPLSQQATNTGVPHAPNFARLPGCAAPGAHCGGWAPPPVYMIDMKAIPEAPEGSDADRIARGEMAAP